MLSSRALPVGTALGRGLVCHPGSRAIADFRGQSPGAVLIDEWRIAAAAPDHLDRGGVQQRVAERGGVRA